MKIHSMRFGPATNSSSTHSLIFLPEKTGFSCDFENFEEDEEMDFGWDFFIAESERAKMTYLSIALKEALRGKLPPDMTELVCREWTGCPPSGYIDHQSVPAMPMSFGYGVPDGQFVRELREFLLRENLVILGGNDNEEDGHPLAEKYGNTFRLPCLDEVPEHLVCRKDDKGFWTIYNSRNGHKLRTSFEGAVECDKASAPELVDLKITGHCPYQCPYCYQDSSPDGEHANWDNLYAISQALAELKVFEVAIGGGEPTLHPKFGDLLEGLRDKGIVPNFSTKSLDWIRDTPRRDRILKTCGAFALSADRPKEVQDLVSLMNVHGIPEKQAGLHIIVDNVCQYDLEKMLKLAGDHGLRVTLLGYKDKGRGKLYRNNYGAPKTDSWWIKLARDSNVQIGIDTSLAKRCQKDLAKAKVPIFMYETEEGKFSCYIDAVAQKMGPSSFCEDEQMQGLNFKSFELASSIKENFSKF